MRAGETFRSFFIESGDKKFYNHSNYPLKRNGGVYDRIQTEQVSDTANDY